MEMYSGSCALIGMVRVIVREREEGGVWEQRKDEVMRASNTLRRNPSVYRCCLEMRGNEEREQSVVTLAL